MATVWATAALGLAFTLAPSAQGQPSFDYRWYVDTSDLSEEISERLQRQVEQAARTGDEVTVLRYAA